MTAVDGEAPRPGQAPQLWWLNTVTGKRFELSNPTPESIDIVDVAVALAHQSRYAGHTFSHYSVAVHSVVVSQVLEDIGESRDVQRWGLLHDAAEAYVTDVPWPIKAMGLVPGLRELEAVIMRAVVVRFGLEAKDEPQVVKDVDLEMIDAESDDLLNRHWSWETPRPARQEVWRRFRAAPEDEVAARAFILRAQYLGLATDIDMERVVRIGAKARTCPF